MVIEIEWDFRSFLEFSYVGEEIKKNGHDWWEVCIRSGQAN